MKRIYIVLWGMMVLAITATAQRRNAKTDTLMVFGNCSQCKDRIENAVKDLGITKADWGIESKILTVTYDSTKFSIPAIENKLASVGHDTRTIKATDAAYNKLPSCCKYERDLPNSKNIGDTINAANKPTPITGVVFLETKKGDMLPVPNATVKLLNSQKGVVTDNQGVFRLAYHQLPAKVIVNEEGGE